MNKLLDFLDTLIAYVLYGSEDELIKHKSLRTMRRNLGPENQKFMDKRGKKVFPPFASKVHQLYRIVETLRELIPLHKKERDELLEDEKVRDFLVLRKQPEEHRKEHLNFSYDVLYEQYNEYEGDINDFLHKTDKDFSDFKKRFKDEKYFGFDEGLNQVERLASLLEFDFTAFLGHFDPSFSKGVKEIAPNFLPVSSSLILQDLLDLFYITGDFEVSSALRADAEFLLEYYDKDSDTNIQILQESLDHTELLLGDGLSRNVLQTIICTIEFDPYYEAKTIKGEKKYLESFIGKWEERFEQNKELLQQNVIDEKLQQRIEKVFEDVTMVAPSPYDREKEQKFVDRGFHHFSQLQPLRLIKTYYTGIFTKGFFGSLKKVAQEGYFENREFKESYTDLITRLEGYMQEIDFFQNSLEGKGTMSMDDAMEILNKETISEKETETLKRFVQDTNARARRVVENNVKVLNDLLYSLRRITSDYRAKNPRFVSNLRVIAGEKSGEVMRKIEEGTALLSDLVEVLKNYAVVQEEEKGDSGSESPGEGKPFQS